MIQFCNVNKVYANGHQALKNANFHLEKGEMVFLTGHSGAGKTTLLKLIIGLEYASSGQVFVDSKNMARIRRRQLPYIRRKVGVVFQTPRFLSEHTVFYNASLPLIVAGSHQDEMGRRVRAALDKVGLLNKAKCFPSELSTGERQRLGIARAVVNRPQLLIADEPTGNLDAGLSVEILNLFEAFNQSGVSILMATHDLNLIKEKNHRVFTIEQGWLSQTSHTSQISQTDEV